MASKDFEWFVQNDLKAYRGDYVLIADEKVILHNKSLTKILKEFRAKYPDKTPKIAKIPEEDALILEITNAIV
ncbi:MAG: hypothetical protein C4B59_14295 [Candidatus Methanogaster sp.]|uniref:Uncharacterized protein n=1 Tax=Candidatus Methanogaster sp. TaxID=3386292 RepID=A0AC61KZD4_9EURY|nr:MAG: hypothetical protein C4B59_14295 [ANME-2 cluster archaeon]